MDVLLAPFLHIPNGLPFIPRPAESHRLFGAGFLILGTLMTTESLSGSVWNRNRLRFFIFPATLILMGEGMLAVTFIETSARVAHFAMGVPMIIGGWAEARYRAGEVSRRYVDAFLIPALIFAALETLVYHVTPPVTSPVSIAHASLATSAIALAGLRYYQGLDLSSLRRSIAVDSIVLLIGLELFVDASFQK